MKTTPILLLCAITLILILIRFKTAAPPNPIQASAAHCSEDAIKSIPDISERAILSARCAKEKNK